MQRDAAVARVFEPVHLPTMFEETVERLGTAIRVGLLDARQPAAVGAQPREPAADLALDAAPGAHDARAERPPGVHARAPRRHVRGGAAAARRGGRRARWARRPGRSSTTASRSRVGCHDSRGRARRGRAARPPGRARARRWPTPMTSRTTGAPTSGSTSASRRPRGSPRLVRAMTEVQGQMSDLIALIAHPEQVLTHSNAQHRRLVTLLRRGDGARADAPDARAHRGHRAHPRRPDLNTRPGLVDSRPRQAYRRLAI